MDFGTPSRTPWAWFDRESSCWRTSQPSLLDDQDSTWSSLDLPASGMTLGGHVYALPMSAPHMAGSGGSSLLPTPTVGDSKNAANRTAGRASEDSKHHDGLTLVDAMRLLPGAHTPPPSTAGSAPSDVQSPLPLTSEDD